MKKKFIQAALYSLSAFVFLLIVVQNFDSVSNKVVLVGVSEASASYVAVFIFLTLIYLVKVIADVFSKAAE